MTHAIAEGACPACGTPLRKKRPYAKWLYGGQDGRSYFLRVSDIDWIEAARNCVRLHAGEHVHSFRSTTSQLEERLDPSMFLRIHRSTIVNIERVKEICNGGSGHHSLTLVDGTRLTLSKSYWPRLKEFVP